MADRSVELHPAFEWTCDVCGRSQFARCIVAEASDEEIALAKSELGVEPWEEGVLLMMPTTVACSYCQIQYETVNHDGEGAAE